MNKTTIRRRMDKAFWLLYKLKHPHAKNQLVLFSNEKTFCQNQNLNKRNDHWLWSDVWDVSFVMSTKFPATVMIHCVISSDSDAMPLFCFEECLRVNANDYIHVRNTVVKLWMETIDEDCYYVFQQNGSPSHNISKMQTRLEERLKELKSKNNWPPSLPDRNSWDYFLKAFCEKKLKKNHHYTKASLKAKTTEIMTGLGEITMAISCQRFRSGSSVT